MSNGEGVQSGIPSAGSLPSRTPFSFVSSSESDSSPDASSSSGDEDGNEGEDGSQNAEETTPPWPPHPPNDMVPPYYGRPPTPLPPSPSFSSIILRPSRPTTPDASDDEMEPVPRAAPRVPTYEYYGFVLYLFSTLCFTIYLLWGFLPAPFLHGLGITYYPDRWWALAVPAFITVTMVYIYVALNAYNTEILTLKLGAVETIVDEAAQVARVDGAGRLKDGGRFTKEKTEVMKGRGRLVEIWSEGTDAVMDIPIGAVCEVLYGDGVYGAGDSGAGDAGDRDGHGGL